MAKVKNTNDSQIDIFSDMRPEIIGLRVSKIEIKGGEIAAFMTGTCTFGTAMEATPECWGLALADALLGLSKDVEVAFDWLQQAVDIVRARAALRAVVVVDSGDVVQDADKLTDEWLGNAITEYFHDGVNSPNSADGVAVDLPNLIEAEHQQADELYADAVDYVLQIGEVMASDIKNKFKITLKRALGIVSSMELNGFVSPADESGKRVILAGAVDLKSGEMA